MWRVNDSVGHRNVCGTCRLWKAWRRLRTRLLSRAAFSGECWLLSALDWTTDPKSEPDVSLDPHADFTCSGGHVDMRITQDINENLNVLVCSDTTVSGADLQGGRGASCPRYCGVVPPSCSSQLLYSIVIHPRFSALILQIFLIASSAFHLPLTHIKSSSCRSLGPSDYEKTLNLYHEAWRTAGSSIVSASHKLIASHLSVGNNSTHPLQDVPWYTGMMPQRA